MSSVDSDFEHMDKTSYDFVVKDPNRVPDLPGLFELVCLEKIDSVRDEARRLAASGADEGTLVWAKEQTAGRGRLDKQWVSPPGGLYCAVILRPDFSVETAQQLIFVAAISIGQALSNFASAMTDMNYRWPNAVLLDLGKAAGVHVDYFVNKKKQLEWMVVNICANIKTAPKEFAFAAACLHTEGLSQVSELDVLESFSRYFLSNLNHWANNGFTPTLKSWRQRQVGVNEYIELSLKDNETIKGNVVPVDKEGALIIKSDDNQERIVSINEYLGLA